MHVRVTLYRGLNQHPNRLATTARHRDLTVRNIAGERRNPNPRQQFGDVTDIHTGDFTVRPRLAILCVQTLGMRGQTSAK